MKVLVIDDEPGIRRMIVRMLREAGHDVAEAEDGRSGYAAFRKHDPDVVMTDILMPGQDGIETIRTLQAERPGLKIIAMSGGGTHHWAFLDMAGKLGATATLSKPFRRQDLLDLLDRIAH